MAKHWDPRQSGWAGQWDRHPRPVRRPRKRRRLRHWQGNLLILGAVYVGMALYGFVNPMLPRGALPSEAGGPIASPADVRVIDGDTFDYGGMRIRIADIDTPEVNGRCAYETELAARATRRLDSLLNEATFELHPTSDGRDEDAYGRKLRLVTRGGRSVGDMLVAEGLARTWSGRREPWCS